MASNYGCMISGGPLSANATDTTNPNSKRRFASLYSLMQSHILVHRTYRHWKNCENMLDSIALINLKPSNPLW
jgi:hypothetical protein